VRSEGYPRTVNECQLKKKMEKKKKNISRNPPPRFTIKACNNQKRASASRGKNKAYLHQNVIVEWGRGAVFNEESNQRSTT